MLSRATQKFHAQWLRINKNTDLPKTIVREKQTTKNSSTGEQNQNWT